MAWPVFDEEQIADVARVLRSGAVNAWTGPEVARFEAAYAELLGRRHAIAVANGTLALDLALHALDIGPGDDVIVTPRSFVASAACVALAGARPVFADVERDSGNLSAATIEAALTPRTRAVIVVHLAGWPCEMDAIMRLARARGLAVVEDCAQAHGAAIAGRPVGSFGDIATFSFCQDKIVTTGGEGGLLASDDDALWQRAWSRKDHGKDHAAVHGEHPPGFRWLHDRFGTNMRMTGMQAALGLRQLRRLPGWSAARARNAAIFREALGGAPGLSVPWPAESKRHGFYRLYAHVRPQALKAGWSRDRVMAQIVARGVPCFSGSCSEIYREKAFREAGFAPRERLPVARELGETSLAFLVDPSIDVAEARAAARIVRGVMDEITLDRIAA